MTINDPTRTSIEKIADWARRGHDDFQDQAASGDYTEEDITRTEEEWAAVESALAILTGNPDTITPTPSMGQPTGLPTTTGGNQES